MTAASQLMPVAQSMQLIVRVQWC